MSTRSRIGVVNKKTGEIKSIYCHFDGYPEGVGKTLKKYWKDTEKIEKLMKLGGLSCLGKEIGKKQDFDRPTNEDWCLAYGRDRGEKNVKAEKSKNLKDFADLAKESWADYTYLWDGRNWICQRMY